MITNAATSGIKLDKKTLKSLMRRRDGPGLRYLFIWLVLLGLFGALVLQTVGTWWIVPALIAYSIVMAIPAYALSHECAHGTAFRTRWLNELVFWFTSLLYFEEPLHRRYAHASHHTYTWINGNDAQMPYVKLPLDLWGWVEEVLGLGLYWHQTRMFVLHSFGVFSDTVRLVTPESELPRMMRSTRIHLSLYIGLAAVSVYMGWMWPVYLIVLPRVIGGPVMNMLILLQHAEMAQDQDNIVKSTRSFRTNFVMRFLYFNMNYHIEHHLYPTVPFYTLPKLSKTLGDQLPPPDPGFLLTSLEVLRIVFQRSTGRADRSSLIRQAPPHGEVST